MRCLLLLTLAIASALLAPTQQARSQFREPERTGIDSGQRVDWAATISHDGLEAYFTSWRSTNDWDIWSATRQDLDSPWEDFESVDIVNTPGRREDAAVLSHDGLTLTFGSEGREGGYGGWDLWQTTRDSLGSAWKEPVNMGPVINTRSGEGSVTFSRDGLEMIYDNGCCSTSAFRRSTRRSVSDPWSEPEYMIQRRSEHQLGAAGYPALSPDGLSLYFNQSVARQQEDIFVSRRETLDSPFGPPESLGPTINTPRRDMMPRIASDGSLYYVRDATTGVAPWEIWRAEAEEPFAPLMLQAGDADQDLDFDQLDLVRVSQAGKYLTEQAATWGEGDWNGAPGGFPGSPPAGNNRFDQLDIVVALAAEQYLKGPYAAERGDPAFVVSPGKFQDVEAPDIGIVTNPSYRFQQLYDAADFAGLGPGPLTITRVDWRADGSVSDPIEYPSERWIFKFSTTSNELDELSRTFADNVGPNETTVLDGPVTLTTESDGPAGGPKQFDYGVDLETPFVYDPSKGNLLMDLTIINSEGPLNIDFVLANTETTRFRSTGTLGPDSPVANANAPIGGHVIRFTIVPEPASLGILSIALLATTTSRMRRRFQHSKPRRAIRMG